MKVLTLTEPWATLMMLGEKNIETRSWRTHHRGLLAIHAAKTMPNYAREFCAHPEVVAAFLRQEKQPRCRPGMILCVRDLIACVPTTEIRCLPTREQYFGDYSPGRWAWIFSSAIQIISPPVQTKGALRLWEWKVEGASGFWDWGQYH